MCFSIYSFSQSSRQWIIAGGGMHIESIHAIELDDSGNIYVTGSFQDTSVIFGETVISTDYIDMFTVSIKPDGSLNWLRQGKGVGEDSGNDLCIYQNYVYVVGTYRDQIFIGDTLLNAVMAEDVFIVKYDLNGNFQWAESAGGVNEDRGKSIAVDDSGNVVITGSISYVAKFGDYTVPYVGFSDMFIAKYNSEGICQWATSGGGPNWDSGEKVEITKSGDIVVGGNFNDQAVFDTIDISVVEYSDVFIARYSSDGKVQEVASAGGNGNEGIQCMAIDSSANVYISGWYMDNITIGGEKHYSKGVYDVFIAKYKPGSGFVWSKSYGGPVSDEAMSMDINTDHEIYLAGTFEGSVDFGLDTFDSEGYSDGFVVRMDTSGSFDRIFQVGGTGSMSIRDCKSDLDGNLYLAGDFVDELRIVGESFLPVGGYDLFLAKLEESASVITENKVTLNVNCYPNPFREIVTFSYILHQKSDVRLDIYNSVGRLVLSWNEEDRFAGKHIIELSGAELSAGIYFYKLETKEGRSTGKMTKL